MTVIIKLLKYYSSLKLDLMVQEEIFTDFVCMCWGVCLSQSLILQLKATRLTSNLPKSFCPSPPKCYDV